MVPYRRDIELALNLTSFSMAWSYGKLGGASAWHSLALPPLASIAVLYAAAAPTMMALHHRALHHKALRRGLVPCRTLGAHGPAMLPRAMQLWMPQPRCCS